jgi:hypothetical protein
LNLPIVLDADCAGITCDSTTTCEHGQCYASEVSCGSGQDCNDPLTQADGAVADVTTVATDASIIDASSLVDATLTADAGKDAGITSASDGGKDAGSHDPRCGAASAIDTSLVVDNCSGVACLKTNGCCVSSPGGALPDKPVCRDPMYCTSITSPGRACCTDPECGGVGTCCQITADPFKTTTKPALCILPVQGQIGGCFN